MNRKTDQNSMEIWGQDAPAPEKSPRKAPSQRKSPARRKTPALRMPVEVLIALIRGGVPIGDLEISAPKFAVTAHDILEKHLLPVAARLTHSGEDARLEALLLLLRILFIYILDRESGHYSRPRLSDCAFNRPDGDDGLSCDRDFFLPILKALRLNSAERNAHRDLDVFRQIPCPGPSTFSSAPGIDARTEPCIPNRAFRDLFSAANYYYAFGRRDEEREGRTDSPYPSLDLLDLVLEHPGLNPRSAGCFYTPRPIVSHICQEALSHYWLNRMGVDLNAGNRNPRVYRYFDHWDDVDECDKYFGREVLAVMRDVRIVDPACGSGAFLSEAFDLLLRARRCLAEDYQVDNIPDSRRARDILENNIIGFDLNPAAAEAARMKLYVLAIKCTRPFPLYQPIQWNIHVANSLLDRLPFEAGAPEKTGAEQKKNKVNAKSATKIAQAADAAPESAPPAGETNASALARKPRRKDMRPGYDVILMNPPFVPAYSRQSEAGAIGRLGELDARFGGQCGRLNLGLCFLLRACELAGEHGVLGAVLPDAFATCDSYQNVREALARKFPTQRWTLLEFPAFRASVRNALLTCGPGKPDLKTARARQMNELDGELEYHDSTWGACARVCFVDSPLERRLLLQIQKHPGRLGELFEVRDGVNPGPADVRAKLLEGVQPLHPAARLVLKGEDIDPRGFVLRDPTQHILYDPKWLTPSDRKAGASLRDPEVFASPKIVSRQTAKTLIAAIDIAGNYVTLNSVHCIRPKNGGEEILWGLLALLNSPLARLYYALDGGETREILPQVHISWLRMLPLPAAGELMLRTLEPFARDAFDCMAQGRSAEEALGAIHEMVCAAYGFEAREAVELQAAYLARYAVNEKTGKKTGEKTGNKKKSGRPAGDE